MSVREQLGLEDGSDMLAEVETRWWDWTRAEPALVMVKEFQDLRPWLSAAPPADCDRVLLTLAMLAAPDGGDDRVAGAALAHALLPGACLLASSLSSMRAAWRTTGHCTMVPGAEDPDVLIATQLWLEVRSFPWRRLHHVAANILMNTRAAVLREYGVPSQIARSDRTWAATQVAETLTRGDLNPVHGDFSLVSAGQSRVDRHCLKALAEQVKDREQSSSDELADLLVWARANHVISDDDLALLLCLVEEAWGCEERGAPQSRVRRGCGGFTGRDLSTRVGARVGLSEVTVRRRSARAIRALAAASTRYVEYVA